MRPAPTAEVAAVAAPWPTSTASRSPPGAPAPACRARASRVDGGIVVSFERMNRDPRDRHREPRRRRAARRHPRPARRGHSPPHGLVYPVFPGEYSASLGGNVATNAGGMRAVKYGVTRHQVLGLEAVLATGEVIRTGGKFVKATTGYDLTQLIIGSEGTLALVTEATLQALPPARPPAPRCWRRSPRSTRSPRAVPAIVASGIGPLILEYIDLLTMAAITAPRRPRPRHPRGDQGARPSPTWWWCSRAPTPTGSTRTSQRVGRAAGRARRASTSTCCRPAPAPQLIDAREKAFWVAKANGADDIVDVVVPRASIPEFMAAGGRASPPSTSRWIAGCGHAGDGNVHLSVFQPDPEVRARGHARALRGRHGARRRHLGRARHRHRRRSATSSSSRTRPRSTLMRRIKAAFDPDGILNPGTLFD